jgi:trimeric autotransporter adhesin
MMVYETSNHSRNASFSSGSDESGRLDDSSRLKNMMGFGNLLPSLDASTDSHFSFTDYSGRTQTTTSTTLHTSSALSSAGSGAGSSAFLDLDDTVEEELLAFRNKERRTSVKYKIQKAFGKISSSKNKPSSSSNDVKKTRSTKKTTPNNNHSTSTTTTKGKTGKISRSKDLKLEQVEGSHWEEPVKQRRQQLSSERNYDDISVDSTLAGDPPTVCSAAGPEMVDESEIFLEAEKRRSMAPLRRKSSRPRRTDMGPVEQVLDESSGSSQKYHRPSVSTRAKVVGREGLKKARSFRRGDKSSERGSSNEKKRLPPKSKSYGCDRPVKEAKGGDRTKRSDDRPDAPRRAASFVGPERQRNASSRSAQVNAQAAIPNPRPSSRGNRKESIADQRQSSSSGKRRGVVSTTKCLPRSKSSSKIVDDENKSGHGKDSKRAPMSRSKSFAGKAAGGHSEDKSSLSTKELPSRSQSFDGSMPSLVDLARPPRRRSTSRSKGEKKKSNPALNSSGPIVVCRHGEKLGECCYDQATTMNKSSAPPPLFSLDDHFGIEKASDEISIDTASTGLDSADNRNYLSTFLVTSNCSSGKLSAAAKSNDDDEKQRHRRSGSQSRTPSDSEKSRSRSNSKSRSQSRTRSGEEQPARSPSTSRRGSNNRGKTERGRRSIVKLDRVRSESFTQRGRHSSNTKEPSQSQRGRRSISRSKSPSLRPSANESKPDRRPSSRSASRSKSRSPSRRPSISEHQKGRRPSSRGKSRSPSRGPSTRDRRPSSRSKSPRRGVVSETNRGRSTSASRSQHQQQQEERSSFKVRHPSVKAQARERSTSTARRGSSSKNLKVSKEGASTVRRENGNKNIKKHETLSKEDLLPSRKGDASRRHRSLSRTRRNEGENISSGAMGSLERELPGNQHARVSRSLSRTRAKSRGEHDGIGDYLKKQQPEKKNRIDDETNSQTTGTSSNGTNEIIYATPSWMWQNPSNAFQNHFFQQDAFADFNAPNQSVKNNHQSATSFGSHSYDASAEMATPRTQASNSTWGTPEGSISGPGNNSTTQHQDTLKSATSTNISPPLLNTSYSSMGSFPISATPGTKAKGFYGKIMKQEQDQLRQQSELLFQTMKAVP